MDKFWILYTLFLALAFGTMAGGIYYVDTHAHPGGFQIIAYAIIANGVFAIPGILLLMMIGSRSKTDDEP